MEPPDLARAIEATLSIANSGGLGAETATLLQNSNKVALRLLPCDAFARVSIADQPHAAFEIGLAKALAEANCPIAVPDPRIEPWAHEHDGFEVSFWTYHEPSTVDVAPAAYADALHRLHAGMSKVDVETPHFTDRVAHAERLVTDAELTPRLTPPDRELLTSSLRRLRRTIEERRSDEQLLHGEPHPGNVINTATGPIFVDLETCCCGPVEFDVAHAPEAVGALYPGIDRELLSDCRELVLAMVATWRFEPADQFPDGPAMGVAILNALRTGPPWPTVGEVLTGLR